MAPDLNTLPDSPRLGRTSTPSSPPISNPVIGRDSQILCPPIIPAPAITSNSTDAQPTNSHRSPRLSNQDPTGVPLRHPRPLTAAELYLECEKEQEAVVNRLTRELTALRAQSASVASNTSHSSHSTSASLLPIDISDPNPAHQMTGATHPTPSRVRSSSSVSARSGTTASTSVSAPGNSSVSNISTQVQVGSTANAPTGSVSYASAARAAAAGDTALARQSSASVSGTSTPARQSLEIPRQSQIGPLPPRPPLTREGSHTSHNTLSSTQVQPGTPLAPPAPPYQLGSVSTAMQHYADTAAYRTEMEIVRAENEALRQRVRALERALRTRRRRDSSQSDHAAAAPGPRLDARPARESSESRRSMVLGVGPSPTASTTSVAAWAAHDGGIGGVAPPRERSESQSTTASSSRRALAGGGLDDEVRVGESASSVGIAARGP